jgi:hypothetical protein
MLIKAPSSELQDTCTVDGRRLWHLTPRQRGLLAVSLIKANNLTAKAAAAACRVSLSTVYRELARKNAGPRVKNAPGPGLTRKEIVSWWSAASFADQVALVHDFGPAATWDALAAAVEAPSAQQQHLSLVR